MGALKLNFDANFVQSIKRDSIGGVIKDWNGNAVGNFSRPANSLDDNEAEVLALLVGCLELQSLVGFNAII